MALVKGSRIGSYEIQELLGKGGMGEVYRVRDTKLERDVAIKTLPQEFTADLDRLARFTREAKVLASLNHPNIAAIYGLETLDGVPLLILELVDGETLAERLTQGRIAVEESIKMAIDIAAALEAAHEKDVVHRDLKPANIKVTPEGKVKVLDFGLAKALAEAEPDSTLSNSPTLSHAATLQGVILGTAAYMSPEQAKGRSVTRMADIWAFGCVLYEMLAGRPAFEGDDLSEILASVIKGTADFDRLPSDLDPRVRRILRRCLDKDVTRRFRDIGDVRYELTEVLADPNRSAMPHPQAVRSASRTAGVWIAAALIGIVAGFAGWTLRTPPPPDPGTVHRFAFELADGRGFRNDGRQMIAISPDGSRFVFNAIGGFHLRRMAAAEATPIPGTEAVLISPFFSPDGEWVGFYSLADRQFQKIPLTGGAAVLISRAQTPPFGVSWSADNTILYGQPDGVWRVSGSGGAPERIVEAQQGEQVDSPQLLPGGEWVLFTSTRATGPDRWNEGEIVAVSLQTKERKTLWRGGGDGRYVPSGHLVYAFENVLYAVRFDLSRMSTIGGQVAIVEGVRRAGNPSANPGTMNYAFSDTGTLVYIPGSSSTARTLAFVDRTGTVERLSLPPKAYLSPRVSPDGKKIAVETEARAGNAIWIYDLAGTSDIRQLTLKGDNQRPVWTRDSRRITFASDQDGPMSIYSQLADGSGAPERLTTAEKGTEHWPESWSPDDGTLSFALVRGQESGVWTLSTATKSIKEFVDEPGSLQRSSTFSPDGKWIVYHSQETGNTDIYAQPFPAGPKKRITQDRRSSPVWPFGGNELFYTFGGGQQQLFVRTVSLQNGLEFSREQALPSMQYLTAGAGYRTYDVTPDGKRILMILPDAATASRPKIGIVVNWFTELQERVPLK